MSKLIEFSRAHSSHGQRVVVPDALAARLEASGEAIIAGDQPRSLRPDKPVGPFPGLPPAIPSEKSGKFRRR